VSDLVIKAYIVTVKHDHGKVRIRTWAQSSAVASQIVRDIERCPERSILSVKEAKDQRRGM
jgi:hypothetical protein